MNELAEIREELDSLRDRVWTLERNRDYVLSTAGDATKAARAAERGAATARTEWREVVERLEKGNVQIIELLTGHFAACEPARRPENTQSASDKPLT